MAKQSMQRELVSYSIFPEPASSSIQVYINFGKVYRQKIEKLITKANAKSAPTNTEIDQKLNKFGGVIKKTGVAKKKKGSAREDDVYESRKNDYLEQRAQQMSLYASANVFSWYAFWEDYERESIEQAIEDCWFSQVSFWVYEDVIETIRQLNAGSEKVFTSPVKRLIGVNFNKVADYQVSSKANKFVVDTPRYVFKPDAQDLFSTVPLTARACDEEIDVIHFNMAVVVNADSVFSFIQELCKEKDHKFRGYLKKQNTVNYKHNNITVLQYSQEPVELLASEHDRYRYGNSAVVKLNLTCEYIFNRSGYEMIKPASILEKLESDDVKLKKLMKKKK